MPRVAPLASRNHLPSGSVLLFLDTSFAMNCSLDKALAQLSTPVTLVVLAPIFSELRRHLRSESRSDGAYVAMSEIDLLDSPTCEVVHLAPDSVLMPVEYVGGQLPILRHPPGALEPDKVIVVTENRKRIRQLYPHFDVMASCAQWKCALAGWYTQRSLTSQTPRYIDDDAKTWEAWRDARADNKSGTTVSDAPISHPLPTHLAQRAFVILELFAVLTDPMVIEPAKCGQRTVIDKVLIHELDLQKRNDERQAPSSRAIERIYSLRKHDRGYAFYGRGHVRVNARSVTYADDLLLGTALTYPPDQVALLTDDQNLFNKASAEGLYACTSREFSAKTLQSALLEHSRQREQRTDDSKWLGDALLRVT